MPAGSGPLLVLALTGVLGFPACGSDGGGNGNSDGGTTMMADAEVRLAPELGTGDKTADSVMLAYPAIADWNSKRYLLYNGNGFGATGFGIAEFRDGPPVPP